MAIFQGGVPVWGNHFGIDVDKEDRDGFIRLAQTSDTHFQLESVIDYGGATGLEGREMPLSEEAWASLRRLTPDDLDHTDLASVPAPMRWWINTYGRHTPAALIHDRFIGLPDGLPPELTAAGLGEEHIDRYFRYMLGDAGIEFIQRWVMWSAVALRTRWMAGGQRRIGLMVWFVLALAGTVGGIWSAASQSWLTLVAFAIAPWPAALLLWGRQWGAGVWASYVVFPLVLIPVTLAIVALFPFYLLQRFLGRSLERLARKLFKNAIEPSYYSDELISRPGPRPPGDAEGLSGPAQAV